MVSVRTLDDAGGVGRAVPLDRAVAPVTASLPVDKGQRYLAVAVAPQHLPAAVEIERDPESKHDYALTLRRHLADTIAIVPRPERGPGGTGWVMGFAPQIVPAYVLAADDDGRGAANALEAKLDLTQVTRNDDPAVDLLAPTASPVEDLLLVQRVERTAGPARTVQLRKDGGGPTLEQAAAEAGVDPKAILAANPRAKRFDDLYKQPVRVPATAYVSQIFKQPLPAGPMSRLTRQAGVMEAAPAFAESGADAFYAANTNGPNLVLWRTDVAGGGTKRTSVTGGDALDWAPSVGGRLLAYSSLPGRKADARPQIWTADATNAANLSLVLDGGESPAVAPGGGRVCYVEVVDLPATAGGPARQVRRLAVMNADGGERAQLTVNNDYDVRAPAWSPDGRLIVFAADGPGKPAAAPRGDLGALAGVPAPPADTPRNFDLYALRVDAPSAEPTRLTSNLSADTDPCFDRRGDKIYFRSNRGGRWNLWSIKLPAALAGGGQ